MADDKAAFSKDVDKDKLASTQKQYKEQTADKADKAEEAAEDAPKTRDQAEVRDQIEKEWEAAKKNTPPSEPVEDAEARTKAEEDEAKAEAKKAEGDQT